MLDINRFVRARSAKLTKFEPAQNDAGTPNSSNVITDSSLGAEVNGKLKHKVYNVVFEGDYGQTQSVMRSLERLQQLLLVKDYKARMLESETQQKVVVNRQGKIIPSGKPNNRTLIENSFKLEVLLPLTAEEAKQAAAAAAPPPAQ
jgi:type IV pilus assembly protein PilO